MPVDCPGHMPFNEETRKQAPLPFTVNSRSAEKAERNQKKSSVQKPQESKVLKLRRRRK